MTVWRDPELPRTHSLSRSGQCIPKVLMDAFPTLVTPPVSALRSRIPVPDVLSDIITEFCEEDALLAEDVLLKELRLAACNVNAALASATGVTASDPPPSDTLVTIPVSYFSIAGYKYTSSVLGDAFFVLDMDAESVTSYSGLVYMVAGKLRCLRFPSDSFQRVSFNTVEPIAPELPIGRGIHVYRPADHPGEAIALNGAGTNRLLLPLTFSFTASPRCEIETAASLSDHVSSLLAAERWSPAKPSDVDGFPRDLLGKHSLPSSSTCSVNMFVDGDIMPQPILVTYLSLFQALVQSQQ